MKAKDEAVRVMIDDDLRMTRRGWQAHRGCHVVEIDSEAAASRYLTLVLYLCLS